MTCFAHPGARCMSPVRLQLTELMYGASIGRPEMGGSMKDFGDPLTAVFGPPGCVVRARDRFL